MNRDVVRQLDVEGEGKEDKEDTHIQLELSRSEIENTVIKMEHWFFHLEHCVIDKPRVL